MPTQTKATAVLQFSSQSLGFKAARRMQTRQVTETLRRWNLTEGVVSARPLRPGENLRLYLDGRLLGEAKLRSVERVRWAYLNLEDARRQGFDNEQSLRDSLRRSGLYRPLDEYTLFRIRWMWTNTEG